MQIMIDRKELPDNVDLKMIHERIDELAEWYGKIQGQTEELKDRIGLLVKTIEETKNG
jgi:hypothetical protein